MMRPHGELVVLHKQRNIKQVLGPPGAPVAMIYRGSQYMVKLAETSKTQEKLVVNLEGQVRCEDGQWVMSLHTYYW